MILSVTDELGDRYEVPVHELMVRAGDAYHVAYVQLPDGRVERQPDIPPQAWADGKFMWRTQGGTCITFEWPDPV